MWVDTGCCMMFASVMIVGILMLDQVAVTREGISLLHMFDALAG